MLKLYNSLTRKVEEFKPLNPPEVGMYTCGPTVYYYPHVGNYRTFVLYDLLRRVLEEDGYQVTQVMNATDVGHLTGDNIGDADVGVDRVEREAEREGKTVWQVAQFYIDDFLQSLEWLNILSPHHFVRATDHIKEQIELIQKLVSNGLAYETETGVFFDVSKFPDYGKLGGQKLVDKRVAVREEVEKDETKRNPQDFALWFKRVGKFADHQMHWKSPWGDGFPGWHIECSAMSSIYLGETFDIHAGGVDHIAIHHTNEIAQSEGATGKTFANYWVHGEFLRVDGGRMGKSLGNAYTLHDIKKNNFDLLALRYLYLTAHYRDQLNFTWESLQAAQNALNNLREIVRSWPQISLSEQSKGKVGQFWQRFLEAANNDLNMPQAIAVLHEMVKSQIPDNEKTETILLMDKILGLKLDGYLGKPLEVPDNVLELVSERERAREGKDFDKSDSLRREVRKLGYEIEDTPEGPKIKQSS